MSYPGYGSVGSPDTIIGGHYAQIIGNPNFQAVIGQAINQAFAQKMAEARAIDPNAVAVAPRSRDERRRQVIGHAARTIAAGAVEDIELKPQQLFRVERIFIPSDISAGVEVVDLKVGNISQLLQAGALPGAMFSEVSIDSYVDFDSADIGNTITLQVRNITGEPLEFRSALAGTVVK
jgi:hypothetical protein